MGPELRPGHWTKICMPMWHCNKYIMIEMDYTAVTDTTNQAIIGFTIILNIVGECYLVKIASKSKAQGFRVSSAISIVKIK